MAEKEVLASGEWETKGHFSTTVVVSADRSHYTRKYKCICIHTDIICLWLLFVFLDGNILYTLFCILLFPLNDIAQRLFLIFFSAVLCGCALAYLITPVLMDIEVDGNPLLL